MQKVFFFLEILFEKVWLCYIQGQDSHVLFTLDNLFKLNSPTESVVFLLLAKFLQVCIFS